jgi:3-deoxy-D-manno-octulosonic acid (KDO) 8-phosphate synthase
MLQMAFSFGAAAICSADMRSLEVVKTASLSRIFDASSAAVKIRSSWFDSTSNWRSSFSITSGKTARVTSIFGFMAFLMFQQWMTTVGCHPLLLIAPLSRSQRERGSW